jgi:hypothetical protein
VTGEMKVNKEKAINTITSPLCIGSQQSAGVISQLEIWDHLLTDREVKKASEDALEKIKDIM